MSFDLFDDLRVLFFYMRVPFVHVVRRGDEESQVIQGPWLVQGGIGLMKGDVVDSAAELVLAREVHTFRIRLPFDLHVEDFAVELFRGLGVSHV